MKRLLFTLTILLISLITAHAQVNVGDDAPGFTYNSLSQGQVSLSDYEGKVIFLFLFGASCPHCRSNGPGTETDIYQEFKNNTNFVALGLDIWNESSSSVNNFKNVTGITYPLLLNARQSSFDYYDRYTYDRSVVIDSKGKVVYIGNANLEAGERERNIEAIEEALANVVTSAEPPEALPTTISLHQNYPNPFNPSTTINYTLNEAGEVSLKIYNILGSEVATLVDGPQQAGQHTATWEAVSNSGTPMPSGIYIYRLQFGDKVMTKRMTLIK